MNDTMQKLHATQIEIMEQIDSFCTAHQIPYSLYAGTLLGAVRHQGFIPWDDDLDICMHRCDYERFIRLWQENPPAGYLLQNKDNSPGFGQAFTKIRKDHTTFLQAQKDIGKFHTGIFVDIFPIDRLPRAPLARACFRWECLLYLLYTREYVPQKGNSTVKAITRMILRLTPTAQYARIRKRLYRRITRYSHRTDLDAVTIETLGALRTRYPAALLDTYTRIPFENSAFLCFSQWDQCLRLKFGDYMQLPPQEERVWKHHPIVIDFERNYEELEASL